MSDLVPGSVVWLDFGPVKGHEQDGHRPGLVVSSHGHLSVVENHVTILPITKRQKFPNHVQIAHERVGLDVASFVMTEQVRTVDRRRITRQGGVITLEEGQQVSVWLSDWLAIDSQLGSE